MNRHLPRRPSDFQDIEASLGWLMLAMCFGDGEMYLRTAPAALKL